MDEFRFKTRYAGSRRIQSLFQIAFYLVITAFFLLIEAALFGPDKTYTWPAGVLVITLFGLLFCFVFILVCASFTLWIGMLQFLFKYDGRWVVLKAAWFLVVFFGLSYGAAVYYFFVYRKFLKRLPVSTLSGLARGMNST